MSGTHELERAREAFAAHSWERAFTGFEAADADLALAPADLELYARSAYLSGRDDDCVRMLERAYRGRLDAAETEPAAECAFWAAFNLMNRGEMAQAGGWLGRAAELVADADPTSPVRGLLLIPMAFQTLAQGEAAAALETFTRARQIGLSSGQPELAALGGLGMGRTLIALGEPVEGLARLDEVMLGVTAGEISPIVSGIVYCGVIIACRDTYQMRRAAEWTRALSRWCESQPDLVPFRGQCLVHRAQVLMLNGAWEEAADQVVLACRRLSDPPGQPAIGMAMYERGELHRLRGEYAAAEQAYRRSAACGHETQPGFALLRLAQGRLEAADSGIRRALAEAHATSDRPPLLAAGVEISLAAGDVGKARAAADELASIAAESESELLRAWSAQATGSVLLAEGDATAALDELRRAWSGWQELDAPYFAARVRTLRARCCEALGDTDAARMELDAAGVVFGELRAATDLEVLRRLGGSERARDAGVLTSREVQVLRAVATGRTNRAIAEELFLSEKTVARHLSNIYTKLAVSSRSAATAYAYEHDLV